MIKTNKKQIPEGLIPCVVTSAVLILCSAVLFALWLYLKYIPLLLIALILVLPGIINLLLLIPDGRKYAKQEKPQKEKREKLGFRGFVKKIPKYIASFFKAVIRFISHKRTYIMLVLTALVIIGVNLVFWLKVSSGAEHSLSFFTPVLLACTFVLLIVFEKWTRHAKSGCENTRYAVILENLHSFITLGEIILVGSAVIATVCTLKFFDLQKWLVIALALVFVYENLFIVISFAVRIIRQELYTNPEVPLPLFGGGGDLSFVGYLEKNTGITMRSLWSIRLIGKIIPYAVFSAVIVLWLSSGIVQVETYQQGALYRFGKLKEETLKPGIHLTLPWPIDRTEIYNTETVNEITVGYLSTEATDNLWTEGHGESEYKLLLGGGNELVSINLRVEYKIDNLKTYLSCSSSPEKMLESAAYETVTSHTINTDLDTILAQDRTEFSNLFEKELRERTARFNTGLKIVDVVIESIHPPVEVAQIYQKIISAGIEAEKIILDARAQAGVKIAEAQAQHDSDINAANADSFKKKADAQSSVAEFMASVQANKDYGDGYRYYKYLNAVKTAYSDAKIVIVGKGIDSSSIYLGSLS